MTAAVVVAAVLAVAVVVLALSLLRSRAAATSARHAAEEAQAQIEQLRAESAEGRRDLEAALERVAGLESDASDQAVAVADPLELAAGSPGESAEAAVAAPALAALWALTRIRQEWTSRQSAILNLDEEPPEGEWAQATLSAVLEEEVSRIREETGTPGTLRTSLPHEPLAAQSVLLMTSLQALLDALSRHCQGYDLYVHEWEQRLTAIVVCDGFDGPDRVASDAAAVLAAIAPAGGELALDRDTKGRLRARLSLAAIASSVR
jgi:type II secretory pathway pseudopilin PulG